MTAAPNPPRSSAAETSIKGTLRQPFLFDLLGAREDLTDVLVYGGLADHSTLESSESRHLTNIILLHLLLVP